MKIMSFLKKIIGKHDSDFRISQIYQEQIQTFCTDFQLQLDEKEQKIQRLNIEYRAQLDEKEQKIQRLNTAYREQLEGKEQEIQRLNIEYRAQLDEKEQKIQRLNTGHRAQLEGKEQEIQRLNTEYYTRMNDTCRQFLEEEQKINRSVEDCKKKLNIIHANYQNSMKQFSYNQFTFDKHLCNICGNQMRYVFSKKL